MFIFGGWYRPFLYETHPDRKYIWPSKRWHTSSGSVDIEIEFKTLIDKHAALISANNCGALLFWMNYASFLSALIWTFVYLGEWPCSRLVVIFVSWMQDRTVTALKVLVTSWKEKVVKSSRTHHSLTVLTAQLWPPSTRGWFVVNWSPFKPGLYVSVQRLGCVFKVRWSSSIQSGLVFTSICCCSWQWYCSSPEGTSVFGSDQPFWAWYLLFHFLPLVPHISSGDVFICLQSSLDTELHHYKSFVSLNQTLRNLQTRVCCLFLAY